MKENKKINGRLLIRAAEGEADKAELQQLDNWLQDSKDNLEIFKEIRELYQSQAHSEEHYDAVCNRILTQCGIETTGSAPGGSVVPFYKPDKYRLSWSRTAVAAILLLVFVAGLFFSREPIRELIAKKPAIERPVIWKKISAEAGSQLYVTVADGSLIRLSRGSSLQYPEHFNGNERLVKLDGEAFFEITKDSLKPFIVKTENLTTKVLGTSFRIIAFANQRQATVTLVTGKVSVSKNNKSGEAALVAYLTPNEKVIFDKDFDSLRVVGISPVTAAAIKNGKMVFDGNSFEEIAVVLERTYKVKAVIEDKAIASMHLTATFEHSMPPLEDLVNTLNRVSGLHIKHTGDSILIRR